MPEGKVRVRQGLTLVEALIAMVLLAIIVLGALGYQYYAALHARIARAQIAATRTAQLLLEDWKSTGGSIEYDPYELGLGFSTKLPIPSHWSDGVGGGLGTPLHDGVYAVTVDDLPMLVMLRWQDVGFDQAGEATLRQLAVIVNFGTSSSLQADATGYPGNIQPVIMTTYVRVDASGG